MSSRQRVVIRPTEWLTISQSASTCSPTPPTTSGYTSTPRSADGPFGGTIRTACYAVAAAHFPAAVSRGQHRMDNYGYNKVVSSPGEVGANVRHAVNSPRQSAGRAVQATTTITWRSKQRQACPW